MMHGLSSDCAIRRAELSDLQALLPLVAAYRAFYGQTPDATKERAFLEQRLRDGTSAVYLAVTNSGAAGFVQIFETYSTVYLGPSLILEDLFVYPEQRGRGIATALLDRALTHAREAGAFGMFLETAMNNTAAQRVYERAGWTREGRFYKYNAPALGARV